VSAIRSSKPACRTTGSFNPGCHPADLQVLQFLQVYCSTRLLVMAFQLDSTRGTCRIMRARSLVIFGAFSGT
jgi:hypothetical protein